MSEFEEKINLLQQRLENLAKYQEDVHKEIVNIHFEIKSLKASAGMQTTVAKPEPDRPRQPVREYVPPGRNYQASPLHPESSQNQQSASNNQTSQYNQSSQKEQSRQTNYQAPQPERPAPAPKAVKSDLEKFIGENLISKIGIVITVLGVAIGAKYAIDNNLISPLSRIVLGYLFGFGLLAVAVRLKEKYLNFSAVLLSGAMAIQYFITFAAYSFYGLMTQSSAFALMLIFTVFTVLAAIKYNRQVIAHFGLVGAYTIPFLLSDGS